MMPAAYSAVYAYFSNLICACSTAVQRHRNVHSYTPTIISVFEQYVECIEAVLSELIRFPERAPCIKAQVV
jgi:hypothetical protein